MEAIIDFTKYPALDDKAWLIPVKTGDYLIHYLAVQNNPLLLDVCNKHPSLIVNKNTEGKLISHILAKYGYVSLLLKLLDSQKQLVDLLDDEDNHILHYLVAYPSAIKHIVETFKDVAVNTLNLQKETPLYLSIIEKEYKTFKILAKHPMTKIEVSNRNSEVCAILNTTKARYKSTQKWLSMIESKNPDYNNSNGENVFPLFIAYKHKNMDTFDYLIKKGADINAGGIGRNFIVFYFMKRKDWKSLSKYTNILDFNVRNLRWNTIIHEFLETVNEITEDELNFFLSLGIDLNSKNVDGKTVYHLLDSEVIYSFSEHFKTRYIDIFSTDVFGETVLSMWKQSEHLTELLKLWYEGVKYMKINSLLKMFPKAPKLVELEKLSIDNDEIIDITPLKTNHVYSAYLDNLVIYVLAVLDRNKGKLNFITKTKDLTFRISDFDSESSKIIKLRLNAKEELTAKLDCFIEFSTSKIYYWPNLPATFPKDKLTFYMLSLILEEINHSNIVIIDPVNKVVERFDPEGFFDDDNDLDIWLRQKLMVHPDLKDFRYIPDKQYSLNSNLYQLIEGSLDDERPGDPVGYCSAWCLWYLEMRVNNINLKPDELYEKSLKKIFNLQYSIRDYIRSYSLGLVEYRNKFVNKYIGNMFRNTNYLDEENNAIMKEKIDNTLDKLSKSL